ncbi:hypothetical protein BHE74_00055665 [Ensete ventricosum]|nr:hypothetical protein BHE74_00055665 [Ensete ventricosum]RZS26380.1 hypothetical protein BHM03_00059713 [Ensete ventricosum]
MRECSALLGLALALAIGAGDGSLFSYRRVGSGGRLLPWAISPLRSLHDEFKREKWWRLHCDWGWVHGRSAILRQLQRGKGDGCFCNRRGKGDGCHLSVERVVASSPLGGWLVVSRVSDAMDASGQGHSTSHPLFQREAPPLASSQRPALVACFTTEHPSPAVTAGEGCSSAAGYFRAGEGCSSPTAAGSSPAV